MTLIEKKAFLIGTYGEDQTKILCLEHLNELASLCQTYGFDPIDRATCFLKKAHPATYIGKGKLEELISRAHALQSDVIVFDDEITPSQQRHLEKGFSLPILDRTELILEIFSQHARTKEAKLQVELAQNRYQLPRLKRLWTHLSRQKKGGKGFLKGEGERQIQIDRHLIRRRIAYLQKEIDQVADQRRLKRYARLRSHTPSFAIIGYTNVGKSTLLNVLTDAKVLVEDRLFATLDTTARHFTLPSHQSIVLIDTVGFIRKLPHALIAAFKSTLEELVYTDILLHLVDINHPLAEEHAKSTYLILRELNVLDKPIITILNKVDLLEDKNRINLFKLKYPCVVSLSALHKEGIDQLVEMMMSCLKNLKKTLHLCIPQSRYDIVSRLMCEGHIIKKEFKENDILLTIEIPTYLEHIAQPFIIHTNS